MNRDRKALLKQIKEWHKREEHQKIIDAIEALPQEDWGDKLTSLLERAYSNVADSNEEFKAKIYNKDEMNAIDKHIGKYFGKFESVFHEKVSPDIHVDICIIPPGKERNYYTLVTMGMGAHRMNVPEELSEYKLERAELAIALPPDWKLDVKSMRDERWYWPIRLLKSTARLPIQCDTWLGWGHTVGLNEGETYAENTRLRGCILIGPQMVEEDGCRCVLPNGDMVNFYHLIPLYQDEMEYKFEQGADALLSRFNNFSFVVDSNRPSALGN